jgi:hypothetical protein
VPALYRVGRRPRVYTDIRDAEAASVLWWLHGQDPEDCVVYRVVPCHLCGEIDCGKTHLLSEIMEGREDL